MEQKKVFLDDSRRFKFYIKPRKRISTRNFLTYWMNALLWAGASELKTKECYWQIGTYKCISHWPKPCLFLIVKKKLYTQREEWRAFMLRQNVIDRNCENQSKTEWIHTHNASKKRTVNRLNDMNIFVRFL